jgi:phosphatidylglycerophosphatase A
MIQLHKLIATVFGIGYLRKGSGTIAAAAVCIVWISLPVNYLNNYWQIFILTVVLVLGTLAANAVDATWGKDSNRVVVDEVAGMLLTLIFIPVNLKYVVAGFTLFRFFDIVKPLFIRRMEALPKGWGVMADDVLAGIYSNILLQVIIAIHLF